MPRKPTVRKGGGRGRNGEGSAAANPRTEPTRTVTKQSSGGVLKHTGQKEAVQSSRNQMPDIDKRRQAAKRTNMKPLAHNETSNANAHRQPPDPHVYRDVQLPTRIIGQHRNGTYSIAYSAPKDYMPKVRAA